MKLITVLIDEDGNSSVDLAGFTDGSCARVMKDFQGDDQLVAEHKKPEYFRQAQQQKEERLRGQRQRAEPPTVFHVDLATSSHKRLHVNLDS